jgi:hypothetical protein
MDQITTVPASAESLEANWASKEADFLKRVDESINWYRDYSAQARQLHYLFSYISLTCAVLAPLFVVSSAAGTGADLRNLGLPSTWFAYISIILTVIIAFVEGLRRILRPNEKWAGRYTTARQLEILRDEYSIIQIGNSVGDERWRSNFSTFRERANHVLNEELSQFFDKVMQGTSPRA